MIRKWFYLRIFLLISSVLIYLTSDRFDLTPPLDVPSYIWLVIGSLTALLIVIGVQSVNPYSSSKWTMPNWFTNPFQLYNPLHFFHFGAWYFMILGISEIVLVKWGEHFDTGLALFSLGAMMLLAIYLSKFLFYWKFQDI